MIGVDDRNETSWLIHAVAGAAFLIAAAPVLPLNAQGLDSEGAIETIIGSDVVTEETDTAQLAERVEAALGNTLDNAAEIRMRFNIDKLEIVFLADAAEGETPVDGLVQENAAALTELRQSIEGSAIFYHAINSNGILLRDVIAVEFNDNDVTIFALGRDPSLPTMPAE